MRVEKSSGFFAAAVLAVGLLGLVGCGGSYSAPSQPPPTPSSVTISPTSASVKAGTGIQNFTAAVMNDYLNRGVTWALSGTGCSGATCGSLSNMTSSAVTYNAPAAVPNPATVTLTATSVNDTMKSATATITVTSGAAAMSATITDTPRQPALAQTANQVEQTPPVLLGTSGGNIHDASKAFCCSGTLGSLVTKGGVDYILSNNHVLADSDTAAVGDAISQPGLVDVGCNASLAQIVANFSQAISLHTPANVDAAIAEIVPGEVNTSGAILEIGNPASTTAPDDNTAVGRGVAKSGRTTGLTCATIKSVSTNVLVQYQRGCGKGNKFTVLYLNQVLINSSSFSAAGDSGSLIVTSDTVQPIALLFAGSSTTTIGNRISDVTSALGVSFVGPTSTTPTFTCPAAAASTATPAGPRSTVSPAGFARALAAKERHADRLMLDDAVIGVGVGASSENSSEAVVVIYLEEGRAHSPLPAELDGVRTEVVRTDAFRAFGWNEPAQRNCYVK